MSEANEKHCENCRHCISKKDSEGDYIECKCDIDGLYLTLREIMTYWCVHGEMKSEVKE